MIPQLFGSKIISSRPDFEVVHAADPHLRGQDNPKPDVMTLDIEMPNGCITFLKKIMKHFPLELLL